jgi:CheY-like chemotaxis protein
MTPPLEKPRVLIVDDRPANRMAFESVLEGDYAVTLAEDGPRALELARRGDFAVILLDVRMPGMDGFETAEALRGHWATRHTPILFTSAYDQHLGQIKRGFVAGATDFLFSPVDAELLLFKVSTYAALHLRGEEARVQVRRLRKMVESLLAEAERPGAPEDSLRRRIHELDDALDVLQRQITTSPG